MSLYFDTETLKYFGHYHNNPQNVCDILHGDPSGTLKHKIFRPTFSEAKDWPPMNKTKIISVSILVPKKI